MEQISKAIGDVLRESRIAHGLTLRQIGARSKRPLKPSSVGGYERGERTITLERFCELASALGVPPDRMLGEILSRVSPAGRHRVVIDLVELPRMRHPAARRVAEFVHAVKSRRGDFLSDVISLRSGDLDEIALAARQPAVSILNTIRPAVRRDRGLGAGGRAATGGKTRRPTSS